jgi:hypothetical protein
VFVHFFLLVNFNVEILRKGSVFKGSIHENPDSHGTSFSNV